MKKLIVLLMVVALASAASAGLIVGGAELDATITGVDNVDGIAAFGVISGGQGTTDAGFTMLYTGNAAGITDYTSYSSLVSAASASIGDTVDKLYLLEFNDLAGDPIDAVGLLATWQLNVWDALYVLDASTFAVLGSYQWVPEPMTLGLLGFGALLIRRKR